MFNFSLYYYFQLVDKVHIEIRVRPIRILDLGRYDADFFSSALADNRYTNTNFLEPIFGADNTLEIQSSRESTI